MAADTGVRETPIEDHGVIGDRSTVALIGLDGSIDFLCWPRFDSPTIFASLLDARRGGAFSIAPRLPGARTRQSYLPDTNVLVTLWRSDAGSAELVDAMVPARGAEGGPPRLIRRIRATRGVIEIDMRCAPRFDYARLVPECREQEDAVAFVSSELFLRISGSHPCSTGDGIAAARFTLQPGESAHFVLDDGEGPILGDAEVTEQLEQTCRFWRQWARASTYRGRWREVVGRSALLLKLLTSRDHGSIVAAPTFGLPEARGAGRNWDYRAVWVRDASFTVYAFMRLGYRHEASAFMHWIGERAAASPDGRMRIMYAVDGSDAAEERVLDHLAGHRGSTPVRIGNEAVEQTQLDIYGELLDSVYLSNKYGSAIGHDAWNNIRRVIDHVCRNWRIADAGIWEMRDAPREFLHSRLMCWVALDRALRLARKRSLAAPFHHWEQVRNEIHDDIWENFWSEAGGHFVQAKGHDTVDGALLLMPLVRFVSATDPRWLSTLVVIRDRLTEDGLVYRYRDDDGLAGTEGAFTACSFWYVECLARAGRLEEAHDIFEKMLGNANHLGLFAEELGPSGEHLGNFPQALTHLALISAAFYLDRELSGDQTATWRP